MTLYYHGGTAYSVDGRNSYSVPDSVHQLIQVFLKADRSHTKGELQTSVVYPSMAFRALLAFREGLFAGAVRTAGKKGVGGYQIRVRNKSESSTHPIPIRIQIQNDTPTVGVWMHLQPLPLIQ